MFSLINLEFEQLKLFKRLYYKATFLTDVIDI